MVSKHPHCARAGKYARDVVAGRIPACKWVRLACARHLNDRHRATSDPAFPYRFDRAAAERVCQFVELLPHTKGVWARRGETIQLEAWEEFLTCVIFGWMHKSSGFRRFRRADIFVPRKNGKSILAAAWGLYMFAADGEFGAEVYSGAKTEQQAWEVFRPARQIVQRTEAFRHAYGVQANASNLHILSTGSRFEPLIGKPGEGASPSCSIHDEYHEHASDAQVDAMETGMGAREQPLQIIITTAGDNIEGPCYQEMRRAQQVLESVINDETLFACIWTIDEEDDWTSEEALRKANPNYDISMSKDFLQSKQKNAISSAWKQASFKTKHLNLWVGSRHAYFNPEKWIACQDLSLRLEDFEGQPCRIGLDLASKVDIAALEIVLDLEKCTDSFIVHRLRGEGRRYVRFGKYWVPEARVLEPDNDRYQAWVAGGWITPTDGEIIDFDEIEAEIINLSSRYQVEEVAYDPHQATQLVTHLMEEGVPVIEVRPMVLNFSEPMKQFDGIIRAGQVVHDGDPVMAWMVSNVTAKVDAKDNVYPRKEREESKIDGVIAHLMALARWIKHESGDGPSVYEADEFVI